MNDQEIPSATATLARIALYAISIVFAISFWSSIRGLSTEAAVIPRLVIEVLVVLILLNAIFDWRGQRRAVSGGHDRPNIESRRSSVQAWQNVILIVVSLVLYIVAIPRMGFYVSSIAFITGTSFVVGRRLRFSIYLGFSASLVAYLVFTLLLAIRLPTGAIL